MTLNGLPVLNYSVDDKQAMLTLPTESVEATMQAVSDNMMLKDGVGNDFYAIVGYGTIKRVAYIPELSAYEIVLERTSSEAQRISNIEAANTTLMAKLHAAEETNAFLEECIVEMAGIIYA